MKRPVIKSATKLLIGVGLLLLVGRGGIQLYAQGNTKDGTRVAPAPTEEATTASAKPGKKPKKNHDLNGFTPAPRAKPLKDIPIPLSVGEPAKHVTIPETDLTGKVLSMLMAAEVTRLPNDCLQIKEMNMDLFHPDGKEDFHVTMPTSIFNLKTRIITSEDPVTVKTQDFELTGEKMEFNTVDRTGRLIGKVRMLVHNLKQVAGQAEPTPKAE